MGNYKGVSFVLLVLNVRRQTLQIHSWNRSGSSQTADLQDQRLVSDAIVYNERLSKPANDPTQRNLIKYVRKLTVNASFSRLIRVTKGGTVRATPSLTKFVNFSAEELLQHWLSSDVSKVHPNRCTQDIYSTVG